MEKLLKTEVVDFHNILWLKQVGEPGRWAYMQYNEGDLFILRWPKNSRRNPLKASVGDIIVLKQHSRLTHLVIPYSDELIEDDEYPRWPFGRKVICLKRFDDNCAPWVQDIIPFSTSGGSHGNGYHLQSFLNSHPGVVTIEELQQRIWDAFFPGTKFTHLFTEEYQNNSAFEEFPEGRICFTLHKKRERNPELVKQAKTLALNKFGCLKCEICNFSFKERYGDIGENFIEAHHKIPVSKLEEEAKTKIEDIALVCSNCHSMLHRNGSLLSVEQLKEIISNKKSGVE